VGENNRLAPPGDTLLNIGRPTLPDGPGAAPAGTARSGPTLGKPRSGPTPGKRRSGPTPGKPAASEPSWGRVLATTIKLWILRTRRWRAVTMLAAVAVAAVAVLAFSGVFAGTAAPSARARAAGTPSPARAVPHRAAASPPSAAQTAAAAWIAGQLSSGAIIACDPAMCAVLRAQGVTAGRLMPLKPGPADPRGAAVVVTSAPAGTQLTEAYAPAVIASFGSGAARIDVRAAVPGGAAAYQTALRADLAARMSAGAQLLRNNRIHFTAQDAAQLRAGEVDARLLATLAALSSQYSFSVTAFGDASPGVAVLYREVTITSAAKNLTAALALVKAQVPPYLPAQAAIGQPAGLSIEFAAPSPLGLLTAVLDADRNA
jgi:hypothetical protein